MQIRSRSKERPPPELWAKYPKSDRIHPVLRTPAPFDDFDASVTIRFIDGDMSKLALDSNCVLAMMVIMLSAFLRKGHSVWVGIKKLIGVIT
jgi:hypothetical protein